MKSLLQILLVFVSVSCGATGGGVPQSGADSPQPVRVGELRAAPEEVAIEGTRVRLTTSLWVNAEPTMPARTGPPAINGIITAGAPGGSVAGKGIRIDHVWLLGGERVWQQADPPEQDAQDPSYTDASGVARNRLDSPVFRIVVRGGPAWDRATAVDVVVRVVDRAGRGSLLRAGAQSVGSVQ